MRSGFGLLAGLICGLAVALAPHQAGLAQTYSDTGPDAEAYGAKDGYPAPPDRINLNRETRYLVGYHSRRENLVHVHPVADGDAVWAFKRAAPPIELDYKFQGQPRSLALYLAHHPTMGLLVLKDDMILFEAYQYGRSDRDLFLSQSMAKTVTAMLLGIAVAEGRIKSIDDPVETYVPGLKGKEYGRTPIRALLHMSSGVQFTEDYGGDDDIARLAAGLARVDKGRQAGVVGQFDNRVAPPDTRFSYASVETEILGLVLAGVLDTPVAEYLSDKIWRPMGAESRASWGTDAGWQELTFCCLNARLRDYARLGRLLAHDGEWEGRQLIPRQWVIDATSVPPDLPYLAPGPGRYGYGYQTWIVSAGKRRQFALLGIHGQTIYVDPESKLVLVQTSVRKMPANDPIAQETYALWRALVGKYGQP